MIFLTLKSGEQIGIMVPRILGIRKLKFGTEIQMDTGLLYVVDNDFANVSCEIEKWI
jgi:hypothetical protein